MKKSLVTMALAGTLLLTGCSSAPSYQPDLQFQANDIGGNNFDASELEGKDVLIWFWTPWCAICARESQDIASLQKQYPEVTFLGIAGYGTALEMQGFVERTGTDSMIHLNDSNGELWTRFEVPIQPSIVSIDASGEATLKVGPSNKLELEQIMGDLVND